MFFESETKEFVIIGGEMRNKHGKWIMGLGLLHTLVGFVLYWPQWKAFAKKGFFHVNAHKISEEFPFLHIADMARESAHWFFLFGVLAVMFGQLIQVLEEREGGRMPVWLAWECLGMSLLSVWMMPISGMPLLALYSVYMLWEGYQPQQKNAPLGGRN